MTRFQDGPAMGQVLDLARSPLFLRVARGAKGTFDALDLLIDTPAPGEVLFAYRRVGHEGTVYLDYTDKATGRRRGRALVMATYAIVAEQPAQEVMQDASLWRAWAIANAL